MGFPLEGFRILQEHYDIEAECFASPLNCTLSRYCSVALDTDRFFGSMGDFFIFSGKCPQIGNPEIYSVIPQGSYEANPPFVEEVMNNMAQHIEYLLELAESHQMPLSFCIIVPGWDDDECQSFQILTRSRFARPEVGQYLVLEARNHNYRPGMQHRRNYDEQSSNVNSFIFFLQSSEGAKKWPVSEEKMKQLKHALAHQALSMRRKC